MSSLSKVVVDLGFEPSFNHLALETVPLVTIVLYLETKGKVLGRVNRGRLCTLTTPAEIPVGGNGPCFCSLSSHYQQGC